MPLVLLSCGTPCLGYRCGSLGSGILRWICVRSQGECPQEQHLWGRAGGGVGRGRCWLSCSHSSGLSQCSRWHCSGEGLLELPEVGIRRMGHCPAWASRGSEFALEGPVTLGKVAGLSSREELSRGCEPGSPGRGPGAQVCALLTWVT